jgi:RNA polymerase sigma factor (sigma-70 family)
VAQGDARRFEELYRQHVRTVLAYALARTTTEMALEATESTFLVAWRRLHEIPAAPGPWLIGVARRVLADQRRSAGRREALAGRVAASGTGGQAVRDPAEEVTAREGLVDALSALSDNDRELLCLVAWDGLSVAEAAMSLGCSVTAAKVRLHRARRRFETALSRSGPRPDAPALPTSGRSLVITGFVPKGVPK